MAPLFLAFQQELFERNLSLLTSSNPRLKQGIDFDPENARQKRDASADAAEWQSWLDGRVQRLVTLPRFLPRDPRDAESWADQLGALGLVEYSIKPYVDLHDDVHLKQLLLGVRSAIEDSGADPLDDVSIVMRGIPTLVALGTGSGEALGKMLEIAEPFNLLVAVTHWDDFLSSCWHLDWPAIWNRYQDDPQRRIRLLRVHNEFELLSVASDYALLGLEHAYLYHSSAAEPSLKEFGEVFRGKKVGNNIHYLGYTVDEYNMVYNSAIALQRGPKIFNIPSQRLGSRFLICGSGPSLNSQLELIRELSSDHIVVAGGSNYQVLRAAGIDPDFLVLVERSLETYQDYSRCISSYGRSATRLLMSSTCPAELIELFDETCVFFRPALTPLSVFAEQAGEVLNFEGPESANTAMAFAVASGAATVVLFGVDLGTTDLTRSRSEGAAGMTVRKWDLEKPGNFADQVHTSSSQLDVKFMLEVAIREHRAHTLFFNCSDGLFIEGAQPTLPSEYLERCRSVEITAKGKDDVFSWWDQLPVYTKDRFSSSWRARQPREATFRLARSLEELFSGNTVWFPDVLRRLDELLALEVPLREQFPRRIMRSTIYKSSLAITQQLLVMRKAPLEQQLAFGAKVRGLLADMVRRMENEIYALCDAVDVP